MGLPKLPTSDELSAYVEGRYAGTNWEPVVVSAELWGRVRYVRIFLRRRRGASVRERDFQAKCVRYWMKHQTGLDWVVVVYPSGWKIIEQRGGLAGVLLNTAAHLEHTAPDLGW